MRFFRLATVLFLLSLAACTGIVEFSGDRIGSTDDNAPDEPDAGTRPDGTVTSGLCGDGVVDTDEVCDGSCPTVCDDGNSCTIDTLTGSATSCDAVCTSTEITACVDGDGCCPGACDASTDSDCSATCGDEIVDENETCDGNCPTACDDGDACTTNQITGSAENCNVQCGTVAVTSCVDGDGCCPTGCTQASDSDCGAVCGNGVVEGVEVCDGDCPTSCDDMKACTADTLMGSADTCDAVCSSVDITSCISGDGCCPDGCTMLNDDDCEATCGNGVVEEGETCDGACPADCNDGMRCTEDVMTGAASSCDVECSHTNITMCVDGDGCCPDACDETNDEDCSAVCGNGVIEAGETCDPSADCPTSCDDMEACTTDTLVGDPQTCDAQCLHAAITTCVDDDGCCPNECDANDDNDCAAMCGNGVVEPGETCDPMTSCPMNAADCDDQNACTGDTLIGDPANCTAECVYNDVTACIGGDGCCPPACTANDDSDCMAVCDNGVIESGETCDPISSCPTSCDDGDACTTDNLVGDPMTCTAACEYSDVTACTAGDGCCPAGCDETTDADCAAVCDNGAIESGETCDPISSCPTSCNDMDACTTDELLGDPSACTAECSYTEITACTAGDGCCPSGCDETTDADCAAVCDNGVIESGETCDPISSCPTSCDDMDACTTDELLGDPNACSAECSYTDITSCTNGDGCCPAGCYETNDDDCTPVCDNGVVESGETCDPIADCPVDVSDCDDNDACTTDTYSGDASTCDALCTNTAITSCTDGDGCCPAGCTNSDDNDCPSVIDCTDPTTWPSGWTTLEDEIFAETNARRTQPQTCGNTSYPAQPAFNFDAQLREAARCHALDMATNDFFSHTGSDGSSFVDRINDTGYSFVTGGENIAGGNSTAGAIVDQWMNSTGHCQNIMNGSFEDLGVGYAYDASSTWKHYSVQVFATHP